MNSAGFSSVESNADRGFGSHFREIGPALMIHERNSKSVKYVTQTISS